MKNSEKVWIEVEVKGVSRVVMVNDLSVDFMLMGVEELRALWFKRRDED